LLQAASAKAQAATRISRFIACSVLDDDAPGA